jgi:hypothetical protein
MPDAGANVEHADRAESRDGALGRIDFLDTNIQYFSLVKSN